MGIQMIDVNQMHGPSTGQVLADAFSKAFIPSFTGTLQQKLEEHHENERFKTAADEAGNFLEQLPEDASPQEGMMLARKLGVSKDAFEMAMGAHQQNVKNKLETQKVQARQQAFSNKTMMNLRDSQLIDQALSQKPNATTRDLKAAGVSLDGIKKWADATKTSPMDAVEARARKDIEKDIKDKFFDEDDRMNASLKVDELIDKGEKPTKAWSKVKREMADEEKNMDVIRKLSENAEKPTFFSKTKKMEELKPKYKNLSEKQKEQALEILTKEKGWSQEEAMEILGAEPDITTMSPKDRAAYILKEAGGDVEKAKELAREKYGLVVK